MRFRCFTLLLISLVFGYRATATHYRGGEMACRSLGNGTYELSVRIYSDCHHGDASSIAQDLPLYVAVFEGGNRILVDDSLSGAYQPMPLNAVSGCYNDTNEYCAKYAVLKRTLRLSPNADGYRIVNQRCCMGVDVRNIADAGANGLTLQCAIPGTAQLGAGGTNSSPAFRSGPPLRLCINSSFNLDFGASDADGDSLAYHFVSGLAGGTASDAKPVPSAAVFTPLLYAPGCSPGQPLGSSGVMALDAATVP